MSATESEIIIPRERFFESPAWVRFRRHKLGMIGTVMLLVIVASSVFAPFLTPHDPDRPNPRARFETPSSEHLLGTDRLGRDVFSRLLYAGRVSLTVGVAASVVSVSIGAVLGAISGYVGGRLDAALLKIAELVLCFPQLILVMTVVAYVGGSMSNIIIIFGFFGWPGAYRLARGQFLSVRERAFVESARALGASPARIIFLHIFPNILGPLLVNFTLQVALFILAESGLSFLGLGIQPPTASWGNMLTAAQQLRIVTEMPWLWMAPGALISLTVLSINFFGDALRDALDPKGSK